MTLVISMFCAQGGPATDAVNAEEAYRQCVLPSRGVSDIGTMWEAYAEALHATPPPSESLLALGSAARGQVPPPAGLSLDFAVLPD